MKFCQKLRKNCKKNVNNNYKLLKTNNYRQTNLKNKKIKKNIKLIKKIIRY